MSLAGRWPIVAMPDYVEDYRDMIGAAYIEFAADGSGEFAFGCVTGQIFGAGDGYNVAFSWQGNDEMDETQGNGWAEIQPDGSITDKSASIAATKQTSSPASGLLQRPARPVCASTTTTGSRDFTSYSSAIFSSVNREWLGPNRPKNISWR